MNAALHVKNVYKIFGPTKKAVEEALQFARGGIEKSEILSRTGCTLGVNNVSLRVESSEIFVIMGLSGSGKSTLVRHFNRLIEPTAGEILIQGQDIVKLPDNELREVRRRQISMVFQSFALLPHKTVCENIAFGMLLRGDDPKVSRDKAEAWVNGKMGLKGFGDKYPDELSGGMRQRVGLARALVAETDIVLLDEAFSALDPLIRCEMQDLLLQIQREMKKTIVFITHDLDEALRIGTRIVIMKDGTVMQEGKPQEIVESPANDYVRKFVEHRTVGAS
ncbi:glycine betaine/L-proline ABC transporter ATP-binding protein [Cupriavidus sp. L7L]|uniref:quaternary amine ABC transporter ATP-binding protein n=1 Tax=Cupriavidus sp. L7L TaxID=2546443 RepID=UPI00105598C5|nr:betaine/proline/choline family ABC transporter ATP-binding protein [Cupriavidus sp. L7L]TDF62657.1 ATP-binding cassette domain-containing protein [Cupriavidus sp. L7L]